MKVSVSQLNTYVKQILAGEELLSDITVCGEISGLTRQASGHIYFTLKDESAAIKCAFFKPYAMRLTFKPENGMKILATGQVTLYERDGAYQLKVFSCLPDGEGELYKQFELLKKKLGTEGLFDEKFKKPIPKYVKKIGVVTSPTGAVIRDIINVATRRCPGISILLAPVSVQGDDAPRSICTGLKAIDERNDIDVIIVGRGGGSMEDLQCFNDENVARTIFACKHPVISAVGHETDFTIADFVASLRAPTPSAAAELAVFDYSDALSDIEYFERAVDRAVTTRLNEIKARLFELSGVFKDPSFLLANENNRLEMLKQRIFNALDKNQNDCVSRYELILSKLEAYNPLEVLKRGYSVTTLSDGTIANTSKLNIGDEINIRLSDGLIKAEVNEIEKN